MGSTIADASDGPPPKSVKLSPSVDVDGLIAQLKVIVDDPTVLSGIHASQRHEIQRLSLATARSLEQPFDTMMRIMYSPLTLVAARIGQDHGIFAALVEADGPVSLAELSDITGMPPKVVESLLDYMCTQDMVRHVGTNLFSVGGTTKELNQELHRYAAIHFHNSITPGFLALNQQLKAPRSELTPFQQALNTTDDYYSWLENHPLEREACHEFLKAHTDELPSWLHVVDFEHEFAQDVTDEDTIFVDVGGGLGHECKALRERCPGLGGRIILQDKPDVLEKALIVDGMETMSYDYLTEQPVKNARVYFLRQILHNNEDETCVRIIESMLPALGRGSRVIIAEKVLPDEKPAPGAPGVEYSSGLSLAMYAMFKALERRRAHWHQLLGSAGLEIKEIRKINHFDDSLIIAVKKEKEEGIPAIDQVENSST